MSILPSIHIPPIHSPSAPKYIHYALWSAKPMNLYLHKFWTGTRRLLYLFTGCLLLLYCSHEKEALRLVTMNLPKFSTGGYRIAAIRKCQDFYVKGDNRILTSYSTLHLELINCFSTIVYYLPVQDAFLKEVIVIIYSLVRQIRRFAKSLKHDIFSSCKYLFF